MADPVGKVGKKAVNAQILPEIRHHLLETSESRGEVVNPEGVRMHEEPGFMGALGQPR